MSIIFADITLPLWLVVSQWTLLLALGFLVIVMYRQLRFLLHLKDAGTEREGLPIGDKAPAFDYSTMNVNASLSARFEPTGIWSLLVFAEPGCVSCQGTITALDRLAPAFNQRIRLLVITSADPAQVAAIYAFKTASIDINHVSKDVPYHLYRTYSTPFAYLINPSGVILTKGVVIDEPTIRQMIQKAGTSTIKVEFTPQQAM